MGKLFSVITVSYNEENRIMKTIESVLSQNKDNYEYIIIDGESIDGTLKIVKSYQLKFLEKKVPYYVISEQDNGIYDAMNKAIKLAKGRYIVFINSGDEFYNGNVLSNVENSINSNSNMDVYYGKTLIHENGYCRERKNTSINTILKHLPFCHQSSFVSKESLINYRFNPKYKIASDYDLFLRMFIENKKFHEIEVIIAYFAMDGISSKQKNIMMKEYSYIKKKNKVALPYSIMIDNYINNILDLKSRFAKKILKKRYYSEFRGWSKYPLEKEF